MSNRIPDGTYVYAAPTGPPWEEPFTNPVTRPTTTLTITGLEMPAVMQRLDALEREVKELKRALADVKEHSEIKTEIAAVRAGMTEMPKRLGSRRARKRT